MPTPKRKPKTAAKGRAPRGRADSQKRTALTAKQLRFVEVYDGNATRAARIAGYTGSDDTLAKTGFDLLRHPQVSLAIQARRAAEVSGHIATRQERQALWTSVMLSGSQEIGARLKASELLGRSQADFTEKHEVTGRITLEELVAGTFPGGAT